VIPVLTPEEMAAVDQAAPEPVEVLIERAGAAVARAALDLLGGGYGRRAIVIAGKGNNGADGRAAARRLEHRGVRVRVIEAAEAEGSRLPPADLVIDGAYGTGFRGEYRAPVPPPGAAVLAIDVPSGVDGVSGAATDDAVAADATVTLAALKPGLLFGEGRARAGVVEVVDIGLDVDAVGRAHLVEPVDVAGWLPPRPVEAHKWQTAVRVIAGSAGMTGAASLCARAAMRAGAGIVHLGAPGVVAPEPPTEVVGTPLSSTEWVEQVLADLARFRVLVIGPGLGRDGAVAAAARRLIAAAPIPVVVDGDGLFALGDGACLSERRDRVTVLTPHDGEFSRLAGSGPGDDRMGAARQLAQRSGATVLLKGSTTVVADPDGAVLLTATGDARLASAGTGDVLAGVVGAFVAQGLAAGAAAAGAATVHGLAGHLGWRRGLVASDLLDHLPAVLSELA
jgi:NAD(P)H-hydrate epimerase